MKMLQSVELPKMPSIAITLPCCLSGFISGSVSVWMLIRCTVLCNAFFHFWSPDVNECVINSHTCKPNERCVNTVGAFMCERQISCSSGYQLRNGVCEGRYSLLFLFFHTFPLCFSDTYSHSLFFHSPFYSSKLRNEESENNTFSLSLFPPWSNPIKITKLIFTHFTNFTHYL